MRLPGEKWQMLVLILEVNRPGKQVTNPCHYFQRVSHAQPLCKSHGQPYGDDGAHGGAGRPQKGQGRHLRVSQAPLLLLLLPTPPPL